MTKENSDKRRINIQDRRFRGDLDEDIEAIEAVEATEAMGAAMEAESGSQDVDWEQEARRNLELAQRKQAELENFRKRAVQDKDDAMRNAVEALLYDLFPALDGLSQAAHAFKDKATGQDPLLDGVRNTIKVLDLAFEKHGIERICEANVPFDSECHQALAVTESADVGVETVSEIYTEGYRLGRRVLKPAMVRVLKPLRENVEDLPEPVETDRTETE